MNGWLGQENEHVFLDTLLCLSEYAIVRDLHGSRLAGTHTETL